MRTGSPISSSRRCCPDGLAECLPLAIATDRRSGRPSTAEPLSHNARGDGPLRVAPIAGSVTPFGTSVTPERFRRASVWGHLREARVDALNAAQVTVRALGLSRSAGRSRLSPTAPGSTWPTGRFRRRARRRQSRVQLRRGGPPRRPTGRRSRSTSRSVHGLEVVLLPPVGDLLANDRALHVGRSEVDSRVHPGVDDLVDGL